MDKPGLRDALPQPRQSDTRNDPFWSSLDSSLSAAAAATPQPSEPVAKRDLDVGLGDVARFVKGDAFDKADFRPEVRPLILKENAMRLLGVAD